MSCECNEKTNFDPDCKLLLMKSIFLLSVLLLGSLQLFSQNTIQLKWKFINVEDGYDHNNKVQVYVDNELTATSGSFLESEVSSCSFDVSSGSHDIKMVWLAYYNGVWEEHTVENDYSIDCIYSLKKSFSKSEQVGVIWDLDGDAFAPPVIVWGKKSAKMFKGEKSAKSSSSSENINLTVNWKFANVIDGYDHQSRIVVYADGRQLGVSNASLGSKGGTYTIKVPKNTQTLRVMTESLYEGEWQENTRDNEYTNDAFAEKQGSFKSPLKLSLIMDIDTEITTKTWK